MRDKECSSCGYIGRPAHDEYMSLVIDVGMWVIGFVIAVITGIIYFVVLGPLVTLWHIATFRSHRCPRCGNWDMHRVRGHKHTHAH